MSFEAAKKFKLFAILLIFCSVNFLAYRYFTGATIIPVWASGGSWSTLNGLAFFGNVSSVKNSSAKDVAVTTRLVTSAGASVVLNKTGAGVPAGNITSVGKDAAAHSAVPNGTSTGTAGATTGGVLALCPLVPPRLSKWIVTSM